MFTTAICMYSLLCEHVPNCLTFIISQLHRGSCAWTYMVVSVSLHPLLLIVTQTAVFNSHHFFAMDINIALNVLFSFMIFLLLQIKYTL